MVTGSTPVAIAFQHGVTVTRRSASIAKDADVVLTAATEFLMDRRQFVSTLALGALLGTAGLATPASAALPSLRFRDMYRRGKDLSEAALVLEGQRIEMIGYKSPPLKPEINFYVLTKTPMATCPFCDDATDWPNDIVVSYFEGDLQFTRFSNLIRVEGTFDTGIKTDPDTGFVSKVRLLDIAYKVL